MTGQGRIFGQFPSLKAHGMVPYYSYLQRDLFFLLEFESAVACFETQPMDFPNQSKRQRRPATKLTGSAGQIAVLDCVQTDPPADSAWQNAASVFFTQCGWTFQVLTAHDLQSGYRLKNVQLLHRYAREYIDPRLRESLFRLLRQQVSIPMAELLRLVTLQDPQKLTPQVLALVFHHELAVPMDECAIGPDSPVTLQRGVDCFPCLKQVLLPLGATPAPPNRTGANS